LGRAEENPVGGWYGLKKGIHGRFGMYLPPLLEHLGLAEVEHNSRANGCERSELSRAAERRRG
jgi:hypothetical protein